MSAKPESIELLKRVQKRLCVAFNRNPEQRWSYCDESSLAQIVRERPEVESELEELIAYKEKAGRFFPKLRGLLDDWDGTLDRARMPNQQTPSELKTIIAAKDERVSSLRRDYAREDDGQFLWPKSAALQKQECVNLEAELGKLKTKLASMTV